ncbi:MAG: NACHT domain-containing protein [Pleomorphochaeta sp.]
MKSKAIIRYALSNLNQTNKGDYSFELLCSKIIPKVIDSDFLSSSGLSAGGDGGVDGWTYRIDGKKNIKYAFSIRKDFDKKIKEELMHSISGSDKYKQIIYFTNQVINEKEKQNIYSNYNNASFELKIYDLENLVEIIIKNPTFGTYIDLPKVEASIQIEYLMNHNQFVLEKEEIAKYIQREIKKLDSNLNQYISITINDFFSSLPIFTILEADAGCGKTGFLKQIHQNILNENLLCFFPPVYVDLKCYTKNNLLNYIESNLSMNGDYIFGDALLLLDSFDEVPPENQTCLINEIGQLFLNNPYKRKIIISTRTNSYDKNKFDIFDIKINIIKLADFKIDDVNNLIEQKIQNDEQKKLMINYFDTNNLYNNIFIISNIIENYRDKDFIDKDLIRLLENISKKEIKLINRNNNNQYEDFESLALFMILQQTSYFTEIDLLKSFGINLDIKQFSFSHKNILEFLAAKKISKQNIETIIDLISYNKVIPNFLTNTIGYLLNILISDNELYFKFKELLDLILINDDNILKLTLIESDKISKEVINQIIKSILASNSLYLRYSEIPNSLISFITQNKYKEKNIDLVIETICKEKNIRKKVFAVSLLKQITRYGKNISKNQKIILFNYVYRLLEYDKVEIEQYLITDLSYIFANLDLSQEIEKHIILEFCFKLIKVTDLSSTINNICKILFINKIKFNKRIYFKILSFIVCNCNSYGGAYTVPQEINDDTYFEPMNIIFWENYIDLTNEYLLKDSKIIWQVIEKLNIKRIEVFSNDSSFKELIDKFNQAFEKEITKKPFDGYKFELIIKWIEINKSIGTFEQIWDILIQNCNTIIMNKISMRLIFNDSISFIEKFILDYYVNSIVISKETFLVFKKEFLYSQDSNLKNFFEHFIYNIDEKTPIYDIVLKNIPKYLLQRIKAKNELVTYEQIKQIKEKKSKIDYSIIFNKTDLILEVKKIFLYFNVETLTMDKYSNQYFKNKLLNFNLFATYLLQEELRFEEKNYISLEKLVEIIENSWDINFIGFFLDYNKLYYIDINIIKEEEQNKIKEWCLKIIYEQPLLSIDNRLLKIHWTLSYVLENFNFLKNDNNFKEKIKGKIFNLIFLGCSIEFLLDYILEDNIIEYISDNLLKAINRNFKIWKICDYLLSTKYVIKPYQNEKFKIIFSNYIKFHIDDENYFYEIYNVSRKFGFKITDLDNNLIAKNLKLDNKNIGLRNNYCYAFYNNIAELNDYELNYLLEATLIAYNNSSNEFLKKILAEYYIAYKKDKHSGQVFEYYANYLLENDSHSMSERFCNFDTFLRTSDFVHLELVNKLYEYSWYKQEPSERRNAIRSIAINSYKEIGENIKTQEELDVLLQSIMSLANNGHSYLYKIIKEISESFAKKHLHVFSVEDILQLE